MDEISNMHMSNKVVKEWQRIESIKEKIIACLAFSTVE